MTFAPPSFTASNLPGSTYPTSQPQEVPPSTCPSPCRVHLASSLAFALSLFPLLLPQIARALGPVVIDEVLANNQRAVAVNGRFPDFVELRNVSSAPVPLGGSRLSDDSGALTAFTLPQNLALNPGARLVIWCDRDPGLPAPQATFGIGSSGDRLRLFAPDGTLWDDVAFGLQVADHSLGRLPATDPPADNWTLVVPSPGAANAEVTLGIPTALRINEWMPAPATGDDWLEVFNPTDHPIDLSGMCLSDRVTVPPANRPIPSLSFIAPSGYVQFFASDLQQPDADHLDFRLSAGGEQIILVAADRRTLLDQVTFGALANNTSGGRSPDGGDAFLEFAPGFATPGAPNGKELSRVRISEILSHTDPPLEDAIELHNPTSDSVDISHWWLSDAASNPRKYRIPPGTVLAPGGYIAFYEYQFGSGPDGFSLNSYEGDDAWLSVGDAAGNLTGERSFLRFGATPNGVSIGSVVTSIGPDTAPLLQPTFGVDSPDSLPRFRQGRGAQNSAPRPSPVVLGEWHPAPTSGSPAGTTEPFLELLNPGDSPAPLFDPLFPTNAWRLRGDLRFDLPPGITLAPHQRLLLVAFDPAADPTRLAAFRHAFALDPNLPILGPWSGLDGPGPRSIELQAPDFPEGPDKPRPGFVPFVRADRLDYRPASGWPILDSTTPQALRRSDPAGYANEPLSWSVTAPSPGLELPIDPHLDSDLDGMPDAWESSHELDPSSPTDALTDFDADGASNLDEFKAGTHPRLASDVLRLTVQHELPGSLRLTFNAKAARSYLLETSPWPATVPWSPAQVSWPTDTPGPRTTLVPFTESPLLFRLRISVTGSPHSP